MQDKNEKPKRWTWEEWKNYIENKNVIPLLSDEQEWVGEESFHANEPLINWQESEIERLREEGKRLDKVVEYLEGLIEFCDCKNPKADCICSDKNGWHTSKQYKLEKCLEISREALKFYSLNESCTGYELINGKNGKYVLGKRAREAERQINEILKGEK